MSKSFYSIVWIMIEKFSAVFISTVSFLIYSFFLTPTELGIATIVLSVTLGISQTLVILFQDPLIIKKRLYKNDVSTCLFFNIALSMVIYVVLIIGTFLFSNDPEQILLVAIAGLVVPISGVSSIYFGLLRRLHRFKSLAIRTLIGRLLGAIVGSAFAIWGLGAVSMIAQIVTIELFGAIGMIASIRLRPRFVLKLNVIKSLGSQGIVLAARKLSWEACIKGIPLVLAIVSNPYTVGLYAFAWRLVDMPRTAIQSGAMSFVLPFLVKANNNVEKLAAAYIKANKITMLIICPMFVGLALCADPLLSLIFDNKWDDAVPLFQLLCVITVLNCTRIYGPTLFTSLSLPAVGLKTDIISTAVTLLIVVLLTDSVGVLSVAVALTVRSLINYPISVIRIKKYLHLSLFEQISIFTPQIISCTLMALLLTLIDMLLSNEGIELLIIQILSGIAVYTISIWVLDKTTLNQLIKRERP